MPERSPIMRAGDHKKRNQPVLLVAYFVASRAPVKN